jgi:hypothetical protein
MIIVISYSGPGLSGRVARSRRVRLSRRLGILWLIVADMIMIVLIGYIYMIQYPYDPVSLSTSLLHITPSTTKVAIFRPV